MGFKQEYERLKLNKHKTKHPTMSDEAFQRAFGMLYKMKPPKTAAQMESLISEYVHATGGVCTKVSVMGRKQVNKTRVTDVIGRSNTIIDETYIPSSTIKGTSDLIIGHSGKVLYVEIKFSKSDRQRQDQKKFQAMVEDAGCRYVIVKTLDEFLKIYEGWIS